MNYQNKTKDELIKELQKLQQQYDSLKTSYERDIVQNKQAEQATRESEEIFRYIMEYSPINIFIKDKDMRLLWLSKNYETILGKPLKELLGKNMNDPFPPVLAKKMVPDDRRILKEGKVITIEEELNGRFYSTIKFPILIEGKPRYLAGFTIDITERMHAEEEARKSNELLFDLHKHLIEIRENEHTRISREIHDQLGQSLTALKIDMTWLRQKMTIDSEESRKLNEMIELVNVTSMDVNRISSELRPVILDDLGLAAALEWYCEEFANRTGLKVQMEIEDIQTENMDKNLSIYRVAQESLTNIIRHADAKKVLIKLRKIKKDIVLLIQDDGIGISPDKISSGKSLGLLGMSERVNQSGGHMEIIAPDKGGTKVIVYIPIE